VPFGRLVADRAPDVLHGCAPVPAVCAGALALPAVPAVSK
jgi:hypothetical protein